MNFLLVLFPFKILTILNKDILAAVVSLEKKKKTVRNATFLQACEKLKFLRM